MVSVEEALRIINETCTPMDTRDLDLNNATGSVLAADCFSIYDFPHFNQTAMDGYAINGDESQMEFQVVNEAKAGDDASKIVLNHGEACRIFTGAMVPKNSVSIVKQEDVLREGKTIFLQKKIGPGENIRPQGEQIKKHELAVPKFTNLHPGAIGFLAMLGVSKVRVFRKPKIAIIATGNELLSLGSVLSVGKIYESNSHTLLAALRSYGFDASTSVVEDSEPLLKEQIQNAIAENDLVLITGGISVGDYDFVGKILMEEKVEEKFYKVKQKPGKPLFFGKKKNTIIFALPGNPAAVLTSFYMYVLPSLQKLIGRKEGFLTQKQVPMNQDFEKSPNLTFLMKGRIENDEVTILPAQSSAMLSSFINANCIIRLEENQSNWKKGDLVNVLLL